MQNFFSSVANFFPRHLQIFPLSFSIYRKDLYFCRLETNLNVSMGNGWLTH